MVGTTLFQVNILHVVRFLCHYSSKHNTVENEIYTYQSIIASIVAIIERYVSEGTEDISRTPLTKLLVVL